MFVVVVPVCPTCLDHTNLDILARPFGRQIFLVAAGSVSASVWKAAGRRARAELEKKRAEASKVLAATVAETAEAISLALGDI